MRTPVLALGRNQQRPLLETVEKELKGRNGGAKRSLDLRDPKVGFSNWVFGSSSFSFFLSFFRVVVAHPGHASLRSLVDALMASLHAYVGLAVGNLALGRASRCAADTFGFIHKPRPVRDDPVRVGWQAFQVMPCPPLLPDGIRCHLSICGATQRQAFVRQRRQRGGDLWFGSAACPRS